ncbi:MAG: hypothetical protein ABEJ30_03375 [Halorientalis sp.]
MEAAVEELRFVSQSRSRARALSLLAESGPLDRDALEDHIDASHRTVLRVVDALTDRGYAVQGADGLALTPFGDLVADCLTAVASDVSVAVEYRPLLRHAPPALADLDPAALEGADLVVASENDPSSSSTGCSTSGPGRPDCAR